jgi:uncharacterized protein (DUF736 family)
MQLGIFDKDKKTGVYSGGLRTLTDTINGITVTPIQKRGADGPDFRVHGPNGSDFGAGWSKLAKEGGKPYISLTLRDPSFNNGEPLYPILIEGENEQYVLAWEAPDPDRAQRPQSTPKPAPVTTRPAVGAKQT